MVRCAKTTLQYSRHYRCWPTLWARCEKSSGRTPLAVCNGGGYWRSGRHVSSSRGTAAMTRSLRLPAAAVARFALRGIGVVSRKKWLVLIASLWAFQASAQSTYTAASCSEVAVAAAITSEQLHPVDGDIISIPAGSCTWSGSGLAPTFTSSVTIQGAGAISATTGGASTTGSDATAITNNTGSPLMEITTTAGKSFRFTGIAVLENSSSSSQGAGNLVIGGQSSAIRVDHCHFYIYVNGSKGLGFTNGTGVVDHVYINTTQNVTNDFAFYNGANWQGQVDPNGLGNQSWVDTDHFGTSEFMYVEDSQINGGYLGDCSVGGRYVIRYSTVLNTYGMANHGTNDSPWRSCRAAEFYQNTFSLTASCPYGSGNCADSGGITHQNGGTTLLWGNTISGVSGGAGYYNAIDLNDVRLSSATYAETAPPNGWGYCGSAQSGVTSVWDQDSNQTGYPCLDQPGRGAGDLLAGYPLSTVLDVTAGNTRTWPHQALSPIYVWDNTVTGTPISIVGNNTTTSAGTLLADNRDYFQQFGTYGESGTFNGTAGVGQGLASAIPSTCSNANYPGSYPGPAYWATDTQTLYVCTATNTWMAYYTPYTYPHPLTQSSGTVAPPTNLTVVVN
jgi:hypothetical protein